MNRDWGSLESIFSNDGSGGGEGEEKPGSSQSPVGPAASHPPPPPLPPESKILPKQIKRSTLENAFSSDESDWGEEEGLPEVVISSSTPIGIDTVVTFNKSVSQLSDDLSKQNINDKDDESIVVADTVTVAIEADKKIDKTLDELADTNENVSNSENKEGNLVQEVVEIDNEPNIDSPRQSDETLEISSDDLRQSRLVIARCQFPASVHLKTLFDHIYYAGLLPFDGKGERHWAFHTVAFVLIFTVLTLFGFAWLKSYFIQFVEVGNLDQYRETWYYFGGLIIGVAFVVVALWKRKQIRDLLLESTKSNDVKPKNTKVSKAVVALVLLSLISPVTVSFNLDKLMRGYPIKDVVLQKSEYFSSDVFVWSGTNLNSTLIFLNENYGTESKISITTVTFAVTSATSQFFRLLLENFSRDVMLATGLYLNQIANHFRETLYEIISEHPNLTWEMLSELYPDFEHMHAVSTLIDNALGHFFKVIHFDNLVWLSYTALELLKGEIDLFNFLLDLITFGKIVAAYFYAVQSARIGKHYRGAVLKAVNFSLKDTAANLLLEKIKEFPVGIGSGRFRITEAFVASCFTLFLSWVFLIWNVSKEKSAN